MQLHATTTLTFTGHELWRRNFPYRLGNVSVVPREGTTEVGILLPFINPVPAPISMLDARGETLWTYQPPRGGPNVVISGDLNDDGRIAILIGTHALGPGGREAVICALNTHGEPLWISEPVVTGPYYDAIVHITSHDRALVL